MTGYGGQAPRTGGRAGPPGPERPREIDASVLVPVRNEAAHIRETVAAMQAQEFEGKLEFLFIDGRSEDATRQILAELRERDPRIRVLDNPQRRTPDALNIGLRESRGTYIVRMDGHAFYPRTYVSSGIERLRRGDVDWVCGPQIPQGVGPGSDRVALALDTWFGRGRSRKWAAEETVHPASAEFELDTGVFAGVWRRSTLEAHGGWDEGWPQNQDSELAARILAGGGRIMCLPVMGARYIPRETLKGLGRQYWGYGYYRAKTSSRHPASLRRSHLLLPALALGVVTSVVSPSRPRRVARAATGAYFGALVAVSVKTGGTADLREVARLPATFACMHLAFGFGFLAGCARFGPPLRALARMAPGRASR